MRKFQQLASRKYLYILLTCILIGGLLLTYIFLNNEQETNVFIDETFMEQTEHEDGGSEEGITTSQQLEKMIYIDLKGEVLYPGVYPMQPESRVKDLIKKAGGFTKEADTDLINLAQKLVDEMVLYVPRFGENPPTAINTTNSNDFININTASEADLQELDGIGPSKAQAIISYREGNGPFTKVEELLDVNGIGEKLFNQMKDKVTTK
jgi:competence protein ComEA